MKRASLLLAGVGLLALVGCESAPTAADDAKMREALSKPPSMEGMAKNPPKGARQEKGQPGAAGQGQPAGN